MRSKHELEQTRTEKHTEPRSPVTSSTHNRRTPWGAQNQTRLQELRRGVPPPCLPAPVAQRFSHGRAPGDRRRTEHQSSRNREKPAQKSNENRSRTPSIVPKICTGNHQGVSELSRKNRRPISTQSLGNFRSSQEHEKVPQNENHRFLRSRIDSVQLTLRVASTHVIARINAKRTS